MARPQRVLAGRLPGGPAGGAWSSGQWVSAPTSWSGATAEGRRELIAVIDGIRESKQSWQELLRDLKQRGLTKPPKLAVGDGGLGFWAAL